MAMRKGGFKITGVEDAMKRTKKLIEAVDGDVPAVRQIFFEGAEMVANRARALAPKRTGAMAAAVKPEARGKKIPSAVVLLRHKEIRYGPFQEFGSLHAPAQPFMRIAVAEEGPKVIIYIADKLRALIESE